MKYHLVYRKNGRYDPVLGDVEPGFETIDQGALNHPSQPTEVFLEVPRFLETSNNAERNFETTPVPFTAPVKEFRPFSREFYNQNLQADLPNIPTPYNVHNEQTDKKFKLPISEEYDPDGTKIDGRLVEERILKKIREHTTKSRKDLNVNNFKPRSKEKRKSVTFKEDFVLDVEKCSGIETIKSTANSLVDESLERAVTVAEEIIKEMNTELNGKLYKDNITGKNTPARQQIVDSLKKNLQSRNVTQDETCDVPKSVKESIQFYETNDSKTDTIVNKEDKLDDERKLFLMQEIEESIQAGTVRRKSSIFNKDTETMVHSSKLKANQKLNTARNENPLKAFLIGSQTISRLSKIAEKSFTSKSLYQMCMLYLSNVFISLTKPFILTKSVKCTIDKDKSSTSYCNQSKSIEIHRDEENYLNVDNIQRRRKLSGSEMAQLSLKKPKELTKRMDTVITEFHKKLNITDSFSTEKKYEETSKLSTKSDWFNSKVINSTVSERDSNTFNSSEWVDRMSKDEREQVKKDIKLATLAAARRVADRRRSRESQSYELSNEYNVEPMDIATYIAIVESHVYTNKDAIFDDYVANFNKDYLTTEEREYKKLQSEYMLGKSYKLLDHSERKTDETLLEKTAFADEKILGTKIYESKLNTEYVATVKVEHKPVPFISTVSTHETRFEVQKKASEQQALNITSEQVSAVKEIKNKEIIVEYKDDTAIKASHEKFFAYKTAPVVIQNLDEDQIESLTITEVTEEAPSVTTEKEISKAQIMGKETLRQISSDFKEVEIIQEENGDIIENKPEFVVDDKNLVEAHIVNKAIIEDINLVFEEAVIEPIDISIPKEESAVTSIEINEFAKVMPIFNATAKDFDVNYLVSEFIDTNFNYETNQIVPTIETHEISKVKAHCTASVYSVNFESKETENIKIETKNDKVEKVNSIEETKEFYRGLSSCTAICSDIITPMIIADVLKVNDVKHEFATSYLEPNVFEKILPIAYTYISQISVTSEEADIVKTEQLHEEKPRCTEEVKKLYCGYVICTSTCQSLEFSFEECKDFDEDGVKEKYGRSIQEPSVFKTAMRLNTSVLTQICTDYWEVDLIVVDNIPEQIAKVLEESAKFVMVRPICMALGETFDIPLDESKWFDIDMVKEATCSLREVPDKFTITLPIATHTFNTFNINYFETKEIYLKPIKEKIASESEEINKLLTAQGICIGKCKSINFEECNSLDVAEIKYRNPLERIEPTVYKKTLSLNTATAQVLNMVYEEVTILEPQIFKKQIALNSTEVKNLVRIQAICQATEEQTTVVFKEPELKHLTYEVKEQFAQETLESKRLISALNLRKAVVEDMDVNLNSIENSEIRNLVFEKQVATLTIVPDVLKVAISTINDVVQVASTLHENVKTQVIKGAKIESGQIISSSESQQLTKALSIREASLQDAYISVETTQNENEETAKFDNLHLNTIQETSHLKSFDAVKQAVVLLAEEEFEKKQGIKIIKRKSGTVKSKSAHMKFEEAASNIAVIEQAEIKEADSYKEASYKVSKLKKSKEISSESMQQTLNINKSYQLKQSKSKEEDQKELLAMEQELEEDSQIIIKDVTDIDETSDETVSIQMVEEASDNDAQSSRKLRLQSVEVVEIPEDIETVASIEDYTKWEKAKAAIDESAALTVVKKENIEITCPILEVYEIEEEMESFNAESSAITSTTQLNVNKVDIKEIDTQLARGTAAKVLKGTEIKEKAKSIETNLGMNTQESFTSAAVGSAVSKVIKTGEMITSEQSSEIALKVGLEHKQVHENIVSTAISEPTSEALLTSQQSNKVALKMSSKQKYAQANFEGSTHSQEHKSEELLETGISIKKSSKYGHVEDKVSIVTEATSDAQEFKSEELQRKKSSRVALKTASSKEKGIKNIESSTDVQTPMAPPTPLIDEYIFRLVAPLPKSRSTTPVPKDPEPETSVSSTEDDPRVVKKNLIPVVESEISESVQYSSPLPSPPTSPGHKPVYTKPGLNGGMRSLPRYCKPGLRGGSDRPSITQEEILEVRRKSSLLASAITETLKNIEKYKKEVGILKQEAASKNKSDMETDETMSTVKEDDEAEKTELDKKDQDDAGQKKLDDKNIDEASGDKLRTTSEPTETERKDVTLERDAKKDVTDVDEKYDRFSDAFEEVTLFDDIVADTKRHHFETIEECFDPIENDGQVTEGVVEFPTEIVDNENIQSQVAKELTPDRPESLSAKVNQSETKADEEVYGTPDERPTINKEMVDAALDQAADEEVARVTSLTPDTERTIGTELSKERSPAKSPREVELLKEAHVISLTRVLSAHMIRESLSPDPQRSIKGKQEVSEDKKAEREGEKDRSWTSFLQKSIRPGPGQNLKHFADLQNKFEPKEQDAEKNDLRMSTESKMKNFNASPIPWQERALADSLGAPSAGKSEIPVLTPAEPPEFMIAIPPGSIPSSGVKISSRQSSHDVPRIEIEHTIDREDRSAVKVSVDKIVEEALRVAESLEIGEEKNRLIQLLSTNIKNITDSNFVVEDQLSKMRSQLQTLAQVPEIIRRALENLSEQLNVINQRRKEENIVQQKEVTTQSTQANIQAREAIQPQSNNEVDHKAEKMPAETRGAVTVTESTDKVTPQNRGKAVPHQPRLKKPEPMFGRLNPETGDLILPGGRRWRRNREFDEQSIAETILAQSEIIQGKALGINFMKYEKPPIPLDHLQRSEVYKLLHNKEQTPPKRVETLRPAIAEADYRERCRSLSPCPPDASKEHKPTEQFHP